MSNPQQSTLTMLFKMLTLIIFWKDLLFCLTHTQTHTYGVRLGDCATSLAGSYRYFATFPYVRRQRGHPSCPLC